MLRDYRLLTLNAFPTFPMAKFSTDPETHVTSILKLGWANSRISPSSGFLDKV